MYLEKVQAEERLREYEKEMELQELLNCPLCQGHFELV